MVVPVLLEIVLPLEGLSADLAGEGHVDLVAALVDHEVVGLGEAPLAVLADVLLVRRALGAHLLPPAELPAVPLCLHRHYREHPYKFPPLLLLVESLSLSLSVFSFPSYRLSLSYSFSSESLPPLWVCLPLSSFTLYCSFSLFDVLLSFSLSRSFYLSFSNPVGSSPPA